MALTLSCIFLQIPLLSHITELHYFCYLFCYYYLMIALILGKKLCSCGFKSVVQNNCPVTWTLWNPKSIMF